MGADVTLNRRYSALWAIWLLAFAVLEGAALIDPGAGDTLTEHVRQWLALYNPHEWVGRTALAIGLAWLVHHFMRIKKKEKQPVTTVAIMALLSTISGVMDNPLVKRLLKNLSAKTSNTVDDWVVAALYGAEKAAAKPANAAAATDPAKVALGEVQAKYDAIKTAAETTGDYAELHRIKAPIDLSDLVGNGPSVVEP